MATPAPGGFRLSGRKSFVTGGRRADHFLVYAKSPEGPLMLVVEADAPGVNRDDFFETLDGGQHCALVLDEAFVPDAQSLGAPGQGQRQAFDQINRTRLTLAAEAVGLMAYAIDRAASHLQAQRPDGTRLADREGTQLRFAELWMAVFTARSTLYRVAQQFAGTGPGAPEALSALKVLASETAERVLSGALQLCGAQALRSDDPLTRCYREVRSWQFAEGASDVLRLSIAKARLEKGRGAL
jgi:acyl-CoA dehydrogenase